MSIQPLITFKAGQCELTRGEGIQQTVKPVPTPGYVYLYQGEDEFVHFCWRPRDRLLDQSELDLIMIPGDGSFQPYTGKDSAEDSDHVNSPTDGRIFVLKFSSSSQRYLFWLQSKSQHPRGASWFSERDLKIGQVVDLLLTGEEIDVQAELAGISNSSGGNDEDETMEDIDHSSSRNRHGSTGGAGADATGGDVREEGEESREGGADGGRAAGSGDVSAIVADFMNSLKGGNAGSSSQQQRSAPFAPLLDFLWPSHTLPTVQDASDDVIDALCAQLPTTPFLLEAEVEDVDQIDPNSETAQMAMQTLSREEKVEVLGRILRAPQLRAALGSLTEALRTGALPTVSQALKIDVENGGYMRGAGMPLGGDDAIRVFLEGVKKTVEKDKKGGDEMDTS
ncbi:26s proteasome complex ubiquitin receptor protein [Pyrenophora tritici-repentis]|nr:26s proteasome complex ubiquitin receptor protein [Pyrenophora tritici-repentis]KAI1689941.1 26s proteasome complex ubiquitin receptor protein [Pyrenophora tritici-repentis]